MKRLHSPVSPGVPLPARPVDAADTAYVDTVRPPDSVSVDGVDSDDGTTIDTYTRREALADGVLVDVTAQASPAEMLGGFTVPVAVTAALWHAIVAIPPSLEGLADERGRLHDVLWMARLAVRRRAELFDVVLPFAGTRKRTQRLRLHVGPDECGAITVTIGFPEDF